MKNYSVTEQKDSLKGNIYATAWDCGCRKVQGPYGDRTTPCEGHKELPPVQNRWQEEIRINVCGMASIRTQDPIRPISMDGEIQGKIRRRVEDALRKGGTGQIMRCAEIMGIRIDDLI